MEKNLWSNLIDDLIEKGISEAYAIQNRKHRRAFIEIEIQFGSYSQSDDKSSGQFRSTVTRSEFNRVMNYYKRESGNKFKETVIKDSLDKNNRISYDYQTKKTTYMEKIKAWSSYQSFFNKELNRYEEVRTSSEGNTLAKEYNIRINVSDEFEYPSPSKYFQEKVIRNKNRTTFTIDHVGYLDLTEATEIYISKDQNKSSNTKYEIELELFDENVLYENPQKILHECQIIRKVMQDSEILYTNSEKSEMYQYVSNLLKIKDGNLSFSMLPEARDLKLDDMVYGGLVGNEKTQYCVTFKADGIRRWIVFMPTKIWAIMPGTSDVNLLYKFEESSINGSTINSVLVPPYTPGYIVDGELLSKHERKDSENSKWMFYIFDCLVENKEDIRKLPYYERMEKANKITEFPFYDNQLNQMIKFIVKGYKIISGVNHFFQTMKLMIAEEDLLPYKNDGMMFIPVETEYNIYYDNPKLNAPPIFDRVLTEFPDICKWKPKELRSIDFLVDFVILPDGKQKMVLKTGGKGGKEDKTPIVFEGSESYPLMERIDYKHPYLSKLPSQSIVEFAWDERKQMLIPLRVRSDKIVPNRYFTAMNVWKNIFNGIDKETLLGNSFQLMRSYHNRIKLDLYKNIKYTRGHKVLLDIGSGRGGDLKKWNDFELIFAVEPNPEHIKELESRLSTFSRLKDKVILIKTGGEDYETITKIIQEKYGERISTISIMLSMSFFHGEKREGLRKTIEQNLELGGEVLVFTINGDLVQQMFIPSSGEYQEKTLQFLNAKTTYEPNSGKLYIDIPSTIVSEQEEYPPKLSEWFAEWDNFLPMNVSRADKQKFLNLDEKAFSNMFTSFKMILLNGKRSELEIERIVPYSELEMGKFDLYGISVLPSDYFYLSAVLKAVNEEYQNDNRLVFRREMVLKVWEEIESKLTREEKQRYQLPWNDSVLELFSKVFDISILVISGDKSQRKRIFGRGNGQKSERKIIIVGEYLIAHCNKDGLLQTVF